MPSPDPDPPSPTPVLPGETPPPDATAPPDGAERAELQRQGAKAAARGDPAGANPMLHAINQPGSTGESQAVWSGRREAWDRGHAARPARGQALSPMAADAEAGPGADQANAEHHNPAMFGVTRILTFLGDKGLTSASGFYFRRDGRTFLVTSRHVLFDAASEHAPDRIEIGLHTDATDLTRVVTFSIPLYAAQLAVWHQAQDSGGEIDVAALELHAEALPRGHVIHAFGPEHLDTGFDLLDVGDALAIPGFPLGFFDTVHHLPVVRQASVASHYGVRFQGLGLFLTDARMHRGSSGSPVLARVDAHAPAAPRWSLVGVHSSRMDMATRDAELDESLGLNCAWYADVLLTLTGPR